MARKLAVELSENPSSSASFSIPGFRSLGWTDPRGRRFEGFDSVAATVPPHSTPKGQLPESDFQTATPQGLSHCKQCCSRIDDYRTSLMGSLRWRFPRGCRVALPIELPAEGRGRGRGRHSDSGQSKKIVDGINRFGYDKIAVGSCILGETDLKGLRGDAT